MKAFEDLEFKAHEATALGYKTSAVMFFNNGYGVSVITGGYGSAEKPYELAVLFGSEEDYGITYNTPITDDVVGCLTSDEVTALMVRVQKLTKEGEQR